jgi:outer membrane protein OmpA-like peptidoglycan-associated protein
MNIKSSERNGLNVTEFSIQKHTHVDNPGLRQEKEADAMAEQVMSKPMQYPAIRHAIEPYNRSIQRKDTKNSQEENYKNAIPPLHEKEYSRFQSSPNLASQNFSSKFGGSQLPDETRNFMESAFSSDFSQVRIHTDPQAVKMNERIQARAFTYGKDIYFNSGEFKPQTHDGNLLLAHELTHTLQQEKGQKKIQKKNKKKGTEQDKISQEIEGKRIGKALKNANLKYLLRDDLGTFSQKILSDLDIRDQNGDIKTPSEKNKISILEAGAISFTLGMLRLRLQYFEDNPESKDLKNLIKKSKGKLKKNDKLSDISNTIVDEISIKDDSSRKRNKEKFINIIAWDPDLSISKKSEYIETIVNHSIKDVELKVDLYDPKFQASVISEIKSKGDKFFKKMIELHWVDTDGKKDENVEMPDQLLAAVGDGTGSTGLAGSHFGVGYFMYGKESKKNLEIGFPTSGPLIVRLSAYGFDQAKGAWAPLNNEPTKVTVKNSNNELITVLNFQRIFESNRRRTHNMATIENISNKIGVKQSKNEGTITLEIPIDFKSGSRGISFITEASAGDLDEIQIQFSTNGIIAQNSIIEMKIPEQKKEKLFKLGDEFTLTEIYFDTDLSTLKPESNKSLNDLVEILNDHPTMKIEIQGHTDNVGSDDHNMNLSKDRAQAVVNYLASKGIDLSRMSAKGYGETKPIPGNTNKTAEGRTKNRRVIFKVLEN